jgi:Family of unknown function (DUF6338)
VWTQIVPSPERPLKDVIGEVIAFGVLNAAVVAPFIALLWYPKDQTSTYLAFVLGLVAMPTVWPFVLRGIVKVLRQADILLIPERTAWDFAFLKGDPYYVIVHLKDGRRLGGYFGRSSFAGLYPDSGHLYLQEVWSLDAQGAFVAVVPDTKGIILKPDDYHFVELKRAN